MSDCVPYWGYVEAKTGYGYVMRTRRRELAHRMVYEQCFGFIPEGLQVHHVCEFRSCVNPEHLRLVTPAEHNAIHKPGAGEAARRRAATHCKRGHPFDEAERLRYADGGRRCRICKSAKDRERRAA